MRDEYIKEQLIIDKTEEEKKKQLFEDIIRTKEELKNANTNFEYADPELVDFFAYKIKAGQAKLSSLIKEAKEKGLVLDMINEIDIRENLENNEAV